jgi:hypothetical protein
MTMSAINVISLVDIPEANAEWSQISSFALSFDGYRELPDGVCRDLANAIREVHLRGNVKYVPGPAGLGRYSEFSLRACPFFEQRRLNHSGEKPEGADSEYIRALLEALRDRVIQGKG